MYSHENIKNKLKYFIEQNKIPHILFHGPAGSGKRTLVYKFVSDIYENDKQLIKNYTMFADCAHGKGIKFIREDLKFFAKTNINMHGVGHFKTIVLTNADKLTTDAQSALRRCIELFSHNTRFFIIVENKYNLLKPILSRLCEIYIEGTPLLLPTTTVLSTTVLSTGTPLLLPTTTVLSTTVLSTGTNLSQNNGVSSPILVGGSGGATPNDKKRSEWLNNEILKLNFNEVNIINLVNKLYERGYSGLDLMKNLEEGANIGANICTNIGANIGANIEEENTDKLLRIYKLLMLFHKVKAELRNEKMFMTFILTFVFLPNK
jgi:hypothetical protein